MLLALSNFKVFNSYWDTCLYICANLITWNLQFFLYRSLVNWIFVIRCYTVFFTCSINFFCLIVLDICVFQSVLVILKKKFWFFFKWFFTFFIVIITEKSTFFSNIKYYVVFTVKILYDICPILKLDSLIHYLRVLLKDPHTKVKSGDLSIMYDNNNMPWHKLSSDCLKIHVSEQGFH